MIAAGGYYCFKYFSPAIRRELPAIIEKVKYMHGIIQKIVTKPVIL